MRIFQSSIFRALVAITVGILLVKYREDTMKWMTIAAGGLFFVSGAISYLAYLYERHRYDKAMSEQEKTDYQSEGIEIYDANGNLIQQRKPMFPILGVGCMILGVILAVMPTDLIIGVAYVLASILILGSINQLITLALARRYSSIPLLFWLMPLITLVIGILVIAKPMEAATLPLKVIGWGLMVYGVVECIHAIKIYSMKKRFKEVETQAGETKNDVSTQKEGIQEIENAQIVDDVEIEDAEAVD